MVDEKKINVDEAFDSYKNYSGKGRADLEQYRKGIEDAKEQKASSEGSLKKLDQYKDATAYRMVKNTIDQYQNYIDTKTPQMKNLEAYKAKLEEYFKAGGRTELVEKQVKEITDTFVKNAKYMKKSDVDKYEAKAKESVEELKKSTAYLALTSPDLKSVDKYIELIDMIKNHLMSKLDVIAGGDGKGEAFSSVYMPAMDYFQRKGAAAAEA